MVKFKTVKRSFTGKQQVFICSRTLGIHFNPELGEVGVGH